MNKIFHRRDAETQRKNHLLSPISHLLLFIPLRLILLLLISAFSFQLSAFGAFVSFTFTNSVGQPDTNAFKVIPQSGPVANADGSFTTIGVPIRITPNTNGYAVTNLAQNNYLVTNAFLGSGFLIRVPLDHGNTIYHGTAGYTNDPLGLSFSGGNTFVTIIYGTNPPPTFQSLTNALGGTPLIAQLSTNLTASAIPTNFWSTNASTWISNLVAVANLNTNQYLPGTLLTTSTNGGQITFNAVNQTNGFTTLARTNPADVVYTNMLPGITNGAATQGFQASSNLLLLATNTVTTNLFIKGTNIAQTVVSTNTIQFEASSNFIVNLTNIVTTNLFIKGTNISQAVLATNVVQFQAASNLVLNATNTVTTNLISMLNAASNSLVSQISSGGSGISAATATNISQAVLSTNVIQFQAASNLVLNATNTVMTNLFVKGTNIAQTVVSTNTIQFEASSNLIVNLTNIVTTNLFVKGTNIAQAVLSTNTVQFEAASNMVINATNSLGTASRASTNQFIPVINGGSSNLVMTNSHIIGSSSLIFDTPTNFILVWGDKFTNSAGDGVWSVSGAGSTQFKVTRNGAAGWDAVVSNLISGGMIFTISNNANTANATNLYIYSRLAFGNLTNYVRATNMGLGMLGGGDAGSFGTYLTNSAIGMYSNALTAFTIYLSGPTWFCASNPPGGSAVNRYSASSPLGPWSSTSPGGASPAPVSDWAYYNYHAGELNIPGGSDTNLDARFISSSNSVATNILTSLNAASNVLAALSGTASNAIATTNGFGINTLITNAIGLYTTNLNANSKIIVTNGIALITNLNAIQTTSAISGNIIITNKTISSVSNYQGIILSVGGTPFIQIGDQANTNQHFLIGVASNSIGSNFGDSGDTGNKDTGVGIIGGNWNKINDTPNGSMFFEYIYGGMSNLIYNPGLPFNENGSNNVIFSSVNTMIRANSSGGSAHNAIINSLSSSISNNAGSTAVANNLVIHGSNAIISGDSSLFNNIAIGRNVIISNNDSFVYCDGSTTNNSTTNNQFLIQSKNGVAINTNNAGTNSLQVGGNVDSAIGYTVRGVTPYPVVTNGIEYGSVTISNQTTASNGWTLGIQTNGTATVRLSGSPTNNITITTNLGGTLNAGAFFASNTISAATNTAQYLVVTNLSYGNLTNIVRATNYAIGLNGAGDSGADGTYITNAVLGLYTNAATGFIIIFQSPTWYCASNNLLGVGIRYSAASPIGPWSISGNGASPAPVGDWGFYNYHAGEVNIGSVVDTNRDYTISNIVNAAVISSQYPDNTIWVSSPDNTPAGSDSNLGTSNLPLATIHAGFALAKTRPYSPTIIVRGANYTNDWMDWTGITGTPILRSYPQERVIIYGGYLVNSFTLFRTNVIGGFSNLVYTATVNPDITNLLDTTALGSGHTFIYEFNTPENSIVLTNYLTVFDAGTAFFSSTNRTPHYRLVHTNNTQVTNLNMHNWTATNTTLYVVFSDGSNQNSRVIWFPSSTNTFIRGAHANVAPKISGIEVDFGYDGFDMTGFGSGWELRNCAGVGCYANGITVRGSVGGSGTIENCVGLENNNQGASFLNSGSKPLMIYERKNIYLDNSREADFYHFSTYGDVQGCVFANSGYPGINKFSANGAYLGAHVTMLNCLSISNGFAYSCIGVTTPGQMTQMTLKNCTSLHDAEGVECGVDDTDTNLFVHVDGCYFDDTVCAIYNSTTNGQVTVDNSTMSPTTTAAGGTYPTRVIFNPLSFLTPLNLRNVYGTNFPNKINVTEINGGSPNGTEVTTNTIIDSTGCTVPNSASPFLANNTVINSIATTWGGGFTWQSCFVNDLNFSYSAGGWTVNSWVGGAGGGAAAATFNVFNTFAWGGGGSITLSNSGALLMSDGQASRRTLQDSRADFYYQNGSHFAGGAYSDTNYSGRTTATNLNIVGTATNSFSLQDTNGLGHTIYLYVSSNGVAASTLYIAGSLPSQTVGVADWALRNGTTVTGIDGTAVANTTLYTVPTGRQFVVEKIIIIPTTVTTFVAAPTISVGKTGATYVDVAVGTALTGLSTTLTSTMLTPIAAASVIDSGETLVLRVSTGATAAAYTFKAIIIGTLL